MTIAAENHFRDVQAALGAISDKDINKVTDLILKAHQEGRPILTCGNGGSAATAIHFASDLRSLGIQAWDLLSPSKLTQLGNDVEFDSVFSKQYIPGALLIAFSCSGMSENIDKLRYRIPAYALVLFTSDMCTCFNQHGLIVTVASTDYEVIEDVHLAISHALKKELKARMG